MGDYHSTDERGLNERQQRFVEEYLIDLNCRRAAVRAGYSDKSTGVQSSLLSQPAVKAAVDVAIAERAVRTRSDADRVIDELAAIAFCNMADFIAVDEAGQPRFDLLGAARPTTAAIQSLTVDYYPDEKAADGAAAAPVAPQRIRRIRVGLADKKGALELLAKHLGLLPVGRAANDQEEEEEPTKYIRLITGVPRAGNPPPPVFRVDPPSKRGNGPLWVRVTDEEYEQATGKKNLPEPERPALTITS